MFSAKYLLVVVDYTDTAPDHGSDGARGGLPIAQPGYVADMTEDGPCQVCDSRVIVRKPDGWEPGDPKERVCTDLRCETNSRDRPLGGPLP